MCYWTLDPNIESYEEYIGIQELIINEGQNAIEYTLESI